VQEEVGHAHDVVLVARVAARVEQLQDAYLHARLVVVRWLVLDHLHGGRAGGVGAGA
jgi:hypothetical protein